MNMRIFAGASWARLIPMLCNKSKLPTLQAGVLICTAAFAQSLPMANRPEDVGFSSKRLATARGVLKADVDAKRLPGAVLLIARNGKIVSYDALGYQDRASETP
jgi:hypothetical protein